MPPEMTVDGREAFLAAKHVGILSVDGGDGRPPFAVPIWYSYEPGGVLTITTGPKTKKVGLITAAGAFTFTVQDEEPPYRYVTVSGPVVETVDEADPSERLTIAQRYMGEEGGRQYMAEMGGHPEMAIRMRPERWWTFDLSS